MFLIFGSVRKTNQQLPVCWRKQACERFAFYSYRRLKSSNLICVFRSRHLGTIKTGNTKNAGNVQNVVFMCISGVFSFLYRFKISLYRKEKFTIFNKYQFLSWQIPPKGVSFEVPYIGWRRSLIVSAMDQFSGISSVSEVTQDVKYFTVTRSSTLLYWRMQGCMCAFFSEHVSSEHEWLQDEKEWTDLERTGDDFFTWQKY